MKVMNKYKKILCGLLVFAFTILISSCKDFLDEELTTSESTEYFETQEGLDALVTGMYQTLRFHFNYVWAYTTTNYGTDEMAVANDATEGAYNDYTSALNSASDYGVSTVWDNMYGGIASANTVIVNVPLYYDPDDSNYNTRLGEGYFIRAFNYFKLVKQYGGVPLKLTPSTTAETEFTRNTAEECYSRIISDFEEAYNLLPEEPAETGRITKWAAAHFLAKAHLFRASELYNDWNSSYVDSDLEAVIKYGKEVIDAHPLCSNFVDLWNFATVDGSNETVSEIVLAAQFSDNTTTQGRYGNQIHLYYPSVYQNLAGVKRDISGGREFSRMRSTNYALDVYDRVNDSRFWKSFITSYRCNNPTGAPTWGAYAPEGKGANDQKFAGGEEAIRYIVNNAGDDRYTSTNINYRAPHMFVRYFSGEAQSYLDAHGNCSSYSTKSRFIALSKFRDGSRISIASQFGQRDGILARSAEDYLMVAEAYGRQEKYSEALPYINALRERAGYAGGEDRSKNVDGGQAYKNNSNITVAGDGGYGTGYAVYSETNTYWESNNLEEQETNESTKSNMVFNSASDIFNSQDEFYDDLNCSSDAEKFRCFILNERSRELMGELMRWEDLARTKTLETRWEKFNDGSVYGGGTFDASKHYLRPIPQTFLDSVEKDGSPLSSEEKEEMQNPGW